MARFKHVKRGTKYVVVGQAEVQCSGAPIVEGDAVTVYQSEDDGKLYARKREEFEDGRFEEIIYEMFPFPPFGVYAIDHFYALSRKEQMKKLTLASNAEFILRMLNKNNSTTEKIIIEALTRDIEE